VAFNRFSFLSNFPFISIPTINRLSGENQDSEIIGELNRIDAVVQDFITDIEVQNLRRTEQSAQLAREKYGADMIFLLISNSSNLCISSLRLTNGFLNTSLWLLTVSVF
jgi:hypothetical protein